MEFKADRESSPTYLKEEKIPEETPLQKDDEKSELHTVMYQIPDYTNVSVALSEVLAELGLNDVIVNKRRRTTLVLETMYTLPFRMRDMPCSTYIFGSQSEGTTTRGLNPDMDMLLCTQCSIQGQRKNSVRNLLMNVGKDPPPGYCKVQLIKFDALPLEPEFNNENCFRDRQGRIFLKNTHFMSMIQEGQEQHGPALTSEARPGCTQSDFVFAFSCSAKLPVVQRWLSQLQRPWPTEDMKRYIADCPCFLVPVGVKGSANEILEWRISTSLAERCLMFNLNVTQLQVYVLMKMLLKTSINSSVRKESHISSFICKTVLLYCVHNTEHNTWQSHSLIQNLLFSLFILYVCVVNENCPHFIIRSNNLLAGRFTPQAKYQLQKNLQQLFVDIISHKLTIQIDDVDSRLKQKLNLVRSGQRLHAKHDECQIICAQLLFNCAVRIQSTAISLLHDLVENTRSGAVKLLQYLQRLLYIYKDGNTIERSACMYLIPYFCTTLGSIIASENIQSSNIISHQALAFFSLGLNSDVSSSRLKLASVFFCTGDIESALIILRDLEGRYDINVCETVCSCRQVYVRKSIPTRREAATLASEACYVSKMTSSCVIFTQAEKNCIPQELHYEMHRSTREDRLHRIKSHDNWMDWAVTNSPPYLHFLCYKVYGRLQRRDDQQSALNKLMLSIQEEPNLTHKETALNLLGQCMEQENRWNDALHCYIWSLRICPRNNVAKVHICKLLCMRLRQRHD